MAKEKRRVCFNKKGSVQDIIYIIIVLTIISVGTLLVFKMNNSINDRLQDSGFLTAEGSTAMNQVNSVYYTTIDNGFLILMVGLSIAAFALAAMVRVHPVFIVFFLLILVIVIILAAVFSNLYTGIAGDENFSEEADKLKFISQIMGALPFIIGIFGSILAIVMYKSWQGAQF